MHCHKAGVSDVDRRLTANIGAAFRRVRTASDPVAKTKRRQGWKTVRRSSSERQEEIVAGGHHGGAWKVAYADFVTAMMAFFLLMWLLNATTEEQRKGKLADYFS